MGCQSDRSVSGSAGLDRRTFLRAAGAGGMTLGAAGMGALGAGLLPPPFAQGAEASQAAPPPKAKSLIVIGIWGGMSQFETFDPKPNAAPEYRSAFQPIPTNVPGIEICETLPLLAKIADKYAILRTMINPYTGHSTCLTCILSNSMPPGGTQSSHPASRLVYPGVGGVVALKKCEAGEYQGDLPPWISIGRADGAPGEGFLGPKWKPYNVSSNGRARRAADQRQVDRRGLLAAIEPQAVAEGGRKPPAAEAAAALREAMFRASSSEAQDVLDLGQEPPETIERYGKNDFGQSLLLARRVAAYGVPSVSILTSGNAVSPDGMRHGWDMHTHLNAAIKALCPILDQALSALLEDLDASGLLESTIVVLAPENGKAPGFAADATTGAKTNWKPGDPHQGETGGRHHWGGGYSCVVAGGGFLGGRTVGEMDQDGKAVYLRPIYPWDMWESVYRLLGIDPADTLPDPSGCAAPVSQAAACGLPRGGILTEIM
jgi:hypothetical protein